MSPGVRAHRLIDLYRLRAQIETEINSLEASIENEARAIRRARQQAMAVGMKIGRKRLALCGTDSGYHHHRRQLKETPCDACKLAHSAAERLRKQARKEAS